MQVHNINETAPDIFYIFANEMLPTTEHNLKIGFFGSGAYNSIAVDSNFLKKFLDGSAKYLPYEISQPDGSSPSPFLMGLISEYRVEYDIEKFRLQNFPRLPSRLSALYAFGDMETCEVVSKKYNWPLASLRKFKLKDWPLTRIAKVNMEHISLARHGYKVASMVDAHLIWQSYWSGGGEISLEVPGPGFKRQQLNSGVIWEYLIEGAAQLII